MKKHRILYLAAALAGLLISLTSALPSLSRPAFNVYVITAILVLIIYDYTRGSTKPHL